MRLCGESSPHEMGKEAPIIASNCKTCHPPLALKESCDSPLYFSCISSISLITLILPKEPDAVLTDGPLLAGQEHSLAGGTVLQRAQGRPASTLSLKSGRQTPESILGDPGYLDMQDGKNGKWRCWLWVQSDW